MYSYEVTANNRTIVEVTEDQLLQTILLLGVTPKLDEPVFTRHTPNGKSWLATPREIHSTLMSGCRCVFCKDSTVFCIGVGL